MERNLRVHGGVRGLGQGGTKEPAEDVEGSGTGPGGRKGTCRGRRGIRDRARGVQMNLKRTWRD